MKHPSNREFFAYWDNKRGTARAPDRSEIEPNALRELLGDIFVLAYDVPSSHPFRVAGTRVCARFGCDLKNRSFASLFGLDSRAEIEEIIASVAEETLPAVGGIPNRRAHPAGASAAALPEPSAYASQPDRTAGAVRGRPGHAR
jgi:hypothetical protein